MRFQGMQSEDCVELVSGSGVFIPVSKLEEATRDAKTGTQLARKLMDAFWDKDTLAKSTLTPRSKFQYQQLDPTVIKSIEGTIIGCVNVWCEMGQLCDACRQGQHGMLGVSHFISNCCQPSMMYSNLNKILDQTHHS